MKVFFVTNKSTCREWFNRIRLALMTIAVHNQHYELALRVAVDAFYDVEQNRTQMSSANLDLLMLLSAEAMLYSEAPGALHGLFAWCKKMTGTKQLWIKGIADKAARKYFLKKNNYAFCKFETFHFVFSFESALEALISVVNDWSNRQKSNLSDEITSENGLILQRKFNEVISSQVLNFVVNECLGCFLALGQWNDALTWLETLKILRSENPQFAEYLTPRVSDDYVR